MRSPHCTRRLRPLAERSRAASIHPGQTSAAFPACLTTPCSEQRERWESGGTQRRWEARTEDRRSLHEFELALQSPFRLWAPAGPKFPCQSFRCTHESKSPTRILSNHSLLRARGALSDDGKWRRDPCLIPGILSYLLTRWCDDTFLLLLPYISRELTRCTWPSLPL